jgi:hypothetical protein
MKSSVSLAKVWFVFSLMALVFAYGVGVGKWELFPYSLLNRAWDQARDQAEVRLFSSPPDVHERVFERDGVSLLKPERMQPGMTVISSSWKISGEWKVGLKLINSKGDVLHEWLVARDDVFPDSVDLKRRDPTRTEIHGSYVFPNGDALVNIARVGTARLNSCGKVLWTLAKGQHHSIHRAEGGSFWIPATIKTEDPGRFPGISDVDWANHIMKVSENGKVLSKINLLDVLYSNDIHDHIFKTHQHRRGSDVTHLNDVKSLSSSMASEYPLFESGNLLVSLRLFNLVFVFDPETGEVKWHESEPFLGQHDPKFIGDGWIGVFDNRSRDFKMREVLGGSRIVYVQPHTDSTYVAFSGSHLDRFYTRHRGKWQLLENENMLLIEGMTGRVLEVDSSGRPVWEWIHRPSSNSRVPGVAEAFRLDLSRQEIASWPCSLVNSSSTSAQKQSTVP